MSEIFSVQLTAVFTALLGVGAIATAVLAYLAFRKQAREVAAIERQVSDEQELTRQQAELLKVQTGQLEVLRAQLEDQRKASATQAEVLELQAAELRESLEDRKREAEERRRAQASPVFVTQEVDEVWDTPTVLAIAVKTSSQAVYRAELAWHRGTAPMAIRTLNRSA